MTWNFGIARLVSGCGKHATVEQGTVEGPGVAKPILTKLLAITHEMHRTP